MNTTKKISEIVKSDLGYDIFCQEEQCKLLVVLLHGYGSSGDDLISLVPYLRENLPFAHWFAPNGIERMPNFGGYQWCDYTSSNVEYLASGIASSRQKVLKLIDDKRLELGLEMSRVCLIGFSQGAMIAIDLALNSEVFCSTVSFSGAWIPTALGRSGKVNIKTPICLIHGEEDEVVPFKQLAKSFEGLKDLGCYVELNSIARLGHSIDLKGLKIASAFLAKYC